MLGVKYLNRKKEINGKYIKFNLETTKIYNGMHLKFENILLNNNSIKIFYKLN